MNIYLIPHLYIISLKHEIAVRCNKRSKLDNNIDNLK